MQYTYPTLLASCQNYEVDDSAQYETEFDNIVQLSEMRIIKDLNLSVFDLSATGNMVVGTQSLTKPSDYIAIQDLFVTINNERKTLQLRSKSWLDDYWRNSSMTGEPAYFCEDTTTTWLVAPTPDSTYTYKVNYIARPTPMSASNPTTWIGDKLGECLLYATLLGSMPFFREDVSTEQGITKHWENTYNNSIGAAKLELMPLLSAKDGLLSPLTRMGA